MEQLNLALAHLEAHLDEPVDVAALARIAHTSEHHFRRLFASVAGMGLGEYVRRRRMTVAAAEVAAGSATLLEIATRHGYQSADAFSRAFRAVHGIGPEQARTPDARLRSQSRLSFQLTIGGTTDMRYRLVDLPAFHLVGRAARLPLVHHGENPHIAEFVASIPVEETIALKACNDVDPRGVLAVCTDFDESRADGSEFTYLHGVAMSEPDADGADSIAVPAGAWVVFEPAEPTPESLQALWPYAFGEWFPANPWRLAPGPELVAMQRGADGASASSELWLPIEPD